MKYDDVMRQTRTSIDNASEHTLNDQWNDERKVLLSEKWRNNSCPNLENLLVLWEYSTSWLRFEQWHHILQLRREEYQKFSSSDVQLVLGLFNIPLLLCFFSKHIWTLTTALLAKSFLVSM